MNTMRQHTRHFSFSSFCFAGVINKLCDVERVNK